MTVKLRDVLFDQPDISLVADFKNESSKTKYPEVDGVYVLGVLEGEFFVPDGKSVNERFYPRTFWESVLGTNEVETRLRDRTMFGTIGHEDKFIDDQDLAAGKVSHIITKLWIDENNLGKGQALILGTDSGRNLYTYLKAKSKLKISSRAYGDYKSGVTHEGLPVMDEASYKLEGFDIVLLPGFIETRLSIAESQEKVIDNKLILESVINRRTEQMHIKETSDTIQNTPKKMLTAEIKRSRAKAEQRVKELEEELKEAESVIESQKTEIDNWTKEAGKLFENYKKYKALGNQEEISEKFSKLAQYEEISSPEEITNLLAEATTKLRKSRTVVKLMENANTTLTAAEQALTEYIKEGSVADIRRERIKNERTLKAYTAMGTISELQALQAKCKAFEAKLEQEKLQKEYRKYSTTTGQTLETVQEIFESAKSKEDAIKVLSSLTIKPVAPAVSESTSVKPIVERPTRKSVLESKNNKVLETKNESFVHEDIRIASSILSKGMK